MCHAIGKLSVKIMIVAVIISGNVHAMEVHYDCSRGSGLTAHFSAPKAGPGEAMLIFDGSEQRITLPQVVSADGGRYADDEIEFWIKGKNATLTRDGHQESCVAK